MGRIHLCGVDVRSSVLRPPPCEPLAFHRELPGYAASPLREAPRLAARLGLASVSVKDESSRFGLPAFKILGASWAIARALAARCGDPEARPSSLPALRALAASAAPLRLVAATDGNHGRGVARVAGWLGLPATIFVPEGTARSRIDAIAAEGAEVVEVAGGYDETVERAAAARGSASLLIQDHAFPGYDEVPRWVIDGYATIFWEIEQEWSDFDLVLVQVGVGALAAAAAVHYRRPGLPRRPALASVEPIGAACALESAAAGRIVTVPAGARSSIMAGLNCGTPSTVAWPDLARSVDAFVAVDDERAREAVRALAADGIVSGESGAAGAAGLLELLEGGGAAREWLGLARDARVLLLSTEGATDPALWRRIVGRSPEEIREAAP